MTHPRSYSLFLMVSRDSPPLTSSPHLPGMLGCKYCLPLKTVCNKVPLEGHQCIRKGAHIFAKRSGLNWVHTLHIDIFIRLTVFHIVMFLKNCANSFIQQAFIEALCKALEIMVNAQARSL